MAQGQTSVDEGWRLHQLSRWIRKLKEGVGEEKLYAINMNLNVDSAKCAKITDIFTARLYSSSFNIYCNSSTHHDAATGGRRKDGWPWSLPGREAARGPDM